MSTVPRAPARSRPRHAPLRVPAEQLYGRLLAGAAQHALGGPPPPRARLRLADGRLEPLPLERWVGPVDGEDRAVLDAVRAPVLDVGCGPGRHCAALRAAGLDAVGVDLSPVAVSLARDRGAEAILGSVFHAVPRAGSWRTALLLDGNIGIGGSPVALLRRVAGLLSPGGAAVVEVDPPGAPTQRLRVRIEAPGLVSDWFGWARVGADGIGALAAHAGLATAQVSCTGARFFATLRAVSGAAAAAGRTPAARPRRGR
jgi:SAM-dependent methyltransferase